MTILLHICSAQAWSEARRRGEYRADSLDTEGFIHCSTLEQVAKTANRFYAGQTDLVLLVIAAERVLAAIRYEAADADLFPHVYGPINLDAVLEVQSFSPAADGTFEPPHLSSR
jgi:uncharacterized protein (DUF952 family)